MADEITLRWNLTVEKGNLYDRVAPDTQAIDLTTASPAVASGVMIAGTTHEAIPLGDLTTPGICVFKNQDATNFVQVGVDVAAAFVPFVKLLPGESYVMRTGATAPYVKADTAACKFEYRIYDV